MNNIIIKKGIPFYDLAAEAQAAIRGDINKEIPGVKEEISETPYLRISTITIINREGENLLRRPCGTYVTVDAKEDFDGESAKEEMVKTISELLGSILPKDECKPVLVCGIGNPAIASDSLGEKTIARMFPTRHLFQSGDIKKNNFHSTAIFCPNVLGNTGIETAELIKGICDNIHPSAVIAIDALSTTAVSRLGTSFQLTDTGLTPGGGVHNTRPALNQETLGIPVIALGVPTVLYPQALIGEAFETIWDYFAEHEKTAASHHRDTAESYLFEKMQQRFSLGVTPKDIEHTIDLLSQILAGAIQATLHREVTAQNYDAYFPI